MAIGKSSLDTPRSERRKGVIGKLLGRTFTIFAAKGRVWSARCSCGYEETRERRRLDRFCRAGCPKCEPPAASVIKQTTRGIGWINSAVTIDALRDCSLATLARMAMRNDAALITLINKVLNP